MTIHVPASVTGEFAGSKVAAMFPREGDAQAAANRLEQTLALRKGQVLVVGPHDCHAGSTLERKSPGLAISTNVLVSHYKLGVAGLVIGGLAFSLMYGLGVQTVARSPIATGVAISSLGMVLGLFAGGREARRPDQDPYIRKVREALSGGESAVVVHAFDAAERDRAAAAFSAMGKEPIATS